MMTTNMMGVGLLLIASGGTAWFGQEVERVGVIEVTPGVVTGAAADGEQAAGIESAPVVEAWPSSADMPSPTVAAEIDLAICLDTSGSMKGLIDATKQKLWAMVNDLALAEPMPRLRVALLTYGNNGHTPESGWVRVDASLTEDLDLISERLFALSTNGGEEYVGRVVNTAAIDLAWSPTPGALKLIIVAGNESADQDPVVRFPAACRAAIGRDIMVNAIYCGNPADELAPAWREIAKLADGQFASIDHDSGTVTIITPFDAQLTSLSTAVNGTYVPFGDRGSWAYSNQCQQDLNAVGLNSEAAASRAEMKSKKIYVTDWDLVSACADGKVTLADLPMDELPEVMRVMTAEQRVSYLDECSAKRSEITAQIDAVATQRRQFIEQELAKEQNDESRAFDFVLRRAIQEQARQRGFRFPEPAAVPEALEPVVPYPAPSNAGRPQGGGIPFQSGLPFQTGAPTQQGLIQQRAGAVTPRQVEQASQGLTGQSSSSQIELGQPAVVPEPAPLPEPTPTPEPAPAGGSGGGL